MDPQTMMIGAAIFVVSAIVIYLVSVCSMREKTFEQVLEEQRKLQAEEQKRQKTEKEKKVRKRFGSKGKGKKEKAGEEKQATAATLEPSPESESETDRLLEPELQPEIIEPVVVKPVQQQAKPEKKKKEKKQKVEEVVVQQQEALYEPLVKEQVEEVVAETLSAAPVQAEPPTRREKKSKHQEQERVEEQIIQETVTRVEEVVQLQAEPPKAENKRAKKKAAELAGSGDSNLNGSNLVQMVRKATLTEIEVTSLIEIISHKQGGGQAEWTKKSKEGEQLKTVRKELEAKERTLQEERHAAQTANQKMREIRNELTREHQRYEGQERQLHDKLKGMEQEKEALCLRMQHSHDQHRAEVTALHHQLEASKVGQDQQILLQRLTDDNQKLKEQVAQAQAAARRATESNDKTQLKILTDELNKNVIKLNALTTTNQQLEGQLNMYKEKLQRVESSQHDAMNRKINEMAEELRRSESRNSGLGKELEGVRSAAHQSEQELANTRNRMKDLQAQEAASRKLEQQLQESMHGKKDLESRFAELERINKETDSQLKQLKEENHLLAAQLKESKERTSGEGQEAPEAKVNGDLAAANAEDHSQILKEKDGEIQLLQTDLKSKLEDLARITSELDAQKAKNNEIVLQKETVVVEKVTELKQQLASRDEKLVSLETLQKDLASKAEQLKNLQVQLESKDKDLSAEARKNVDHEKLVKELEDRLNGETTLIVQLKEQIASKDEDATKFEVLKRQMSDSEGKVKELQDSLSKVSSLEEELQKLRKENEVLQGHIHQQSESIAQSQAQYIQLALVQNEKVELTDEVQSLKLALEAKSLLVLDLQSKELELQDIKEEMKGVEAEREVLVLARSEANAATSIGETREMSDVNKEIESLKAQLEEASSLNKKIEDLQENIDMLNSVNSKLKQDHTYVSNAAKTAEQKTVEAVEKLKIRSTEFEEKLKSLTEEKDKKILQIETKLKESVTETEAGKVTQEVASKLEGQLKQVEIEKQEFIKTISEMEAKLKAKSDVEKKLEDDRKSVQVQMDELASNLKEKDDKLKVNADLEKKFNELQEDKKSLHVQIEELTSKLKAKDEELGSQPGPEEVNKMKEMIGKYEADLQTLRGNAEQSTGQVSKLSEELQNKSSLFDKVSKELDLLRSENQELSQKVTVATSAPLMAAAPAPSPTKTTLQDVTILTRVEEKSTFDIKHILAELDSKDVELSIMQNVLSQKEAENKQYQKLVEQMRVMQQKLDSKCEDVAGLTEQLNLQNLRTSDLQRQLSSGSGSSITAALGPANGSMAELQQELDVKKGEIDKLRELVKAYWLENNDLKEQMEAIEEGNASEKPTSSEQQNPSDQARTNQIEQELKERTAHVEQLKSDNSTLRDEAAQLKQLYDELKAMNQEKEASSGDVNGEQEAHKAEETESQTKELLSRLYPEVHVSESKNYNEWLTSFEKQIIKIKSSHSSKAGDESKLQAQVQHYKGVLADTESILNKLQNSVEEEENKWRGKLNSSEEEAKRAAEELKLVKDRLSTLEGDRLSLQSQLSEGLANGSSRPQEMEQLKTSLAQTQKQLEREVQANKQLTQRLGEGAEGNDEGSSV